MAPVPSAARAVRRERGGGTHNEVRAIWRGRVIRDWVRSFGISVLRWILGADDAREMLFALIREGNGDVVPIECAELKSDVLPYAGLGCREAASEAANEPVFITGRFRSGSTLLWNLFRHVPGVTAYYEPFNERRWFDRAARGSAVDQSHLGVSDYWAEYDGLAELGQYFDPQWKFRHLYMSASAWNRPMQRYLETLMARAGGRAVLQFNEMDFRLGWLRARFPTVPILHVYRHPRDQWCSTLLSAASTAAQCRLKDFARVDGFYLLSWAQDLRHTFPFLTLEPESFAYELYYQIWLLSYRWGRLHATRSFAFEELVTDPAAGIRGLMEAAGMPAAAIEPLVPLVSAVRTGKWRECASAEWFEAIEARVNAEITAYARGLAVAPRV